MAERKAFNFYRSYYDVFLQLEGQDQIDFITALLKKQFEGEDPKDLKGMANFAYISQKESIEKQVKGWEDKTRCKLGISDPCQGGSATPTEGGSATPTEGGSATPSQQEKEKEKEQEKEQEEGKEKVEEFIFDETSSSLQTEILKTEKKEKKKSSAKKRKEAISPDCKSFFMEFYQQEKNMEFYWTAAEAKALNSLIAKIRSISNDKSDEKVLELFKVFVQKSKVADKWIFENFSVRILDSKFNELVSKMKSTSATGGKVPQGYDALAEKYKKILQG